MLESLRSFLSGKRLIVIAILLAIPFVFFGSASFGTTFSSYGSVNGEAVTQIDVTLASNEVSQRLKSIYGDEFSLDDLDEGIALNLIKNQIINQKTLLSNARDIGIIISEDKARQEIINDDMFQGDQGFDQALFDSTILANGFSSEEYIRLVQETVSINRLMDAMVTSVFPIEKEIINLASMFETSRDINFIKIDKAILVKSQKATLTEGETFYNSNPLLFLSKEKRDFSYIVLSYDAYKKLVEVPKDYVKDAYEDYLRESQEQTQNRISHFMIDKSNYESSDAARSAIDKIMTGLNAGDVSFEEVVASSSEDLASKENQGDLGLSSGDAFPEEFELAILDLDLNDLSPIIELEDSLHILKLTEIIKPEIESINQMEKDLISELVDAEAVALMQDDFIKLEQMVLEGVTFFELADAANQTISVTGLNDIGDTALEGFEAYSGEDLFSPDVLVNKIEIFESDNSYAFVMMTQAVESSVRAFADVAEEAIEEVRIEKADNLIDDFSTSALDIILGDKVLPDNPGFSMESYKSVKRLSSLLPSEVVNLIFESQIGELITSSTFNGDHYWVQSSNELIPIKEDLSDSLDQYRDFYNNKLDQQVLSFIDRAFKQGQSIRLKNF
ncbi:MAG: SurA N-terminal domain-containing protein [Pseudomonadota bacterium]|nr:SurA N-terminal domain-containing protein [Pseudomonadota bacterium]